MLDRWIWYNFGSVKIGASRLVIVQEPVTIRVYFMSPHNGRRGQEEVEFVPIVSNGLIIICAPFLSLHIRQTSLGLHKYWPSSILSNKAANAQIQAEFLSIVPLIPWFVPPFLSSTRIEKTSLEGHGNVVPQII